MKSNNNKYYSPLRYPGGKSCIFSFMSQLFYENELIGKNYAEPYAGGAGLALRLLIEEYVNYIYINDYDPAIYAFWNVILSNPDEFCEWIDGVDICVDSWQYYKKVQQNYLIADSFELAKSTFFLNRTNISGVIKGGIIGGQKQNGSYSINARFNKSDLIDKIQTISKFSNRISVSNLDGMNFIEKLNRKKEDVFIYLDPPYVKKGASLYMNSFTQEDHRNLSKCVSRLKKRWMISYDNVSLVHDLYHNYRKVIYQLSQCASNRTGDEVLIFDDTFTIDNAINSLNNPQLLSCNKVSK